MVGPKAMRLAIDKARASASAWSRCSTAATLGAIGHYAMQAAEQGMVGVCFTGAGLSVVPTFAAKPLLGTNPIALRGPGTTRGADALRRRDLGDRRQQDPAWHIRVGRRSCGLGHGQRGHPDHGGEARLDRDEYHQAPLGGTREQGSHKGYGFAMMARSCPPSSRRALPTMLSAAADRRINSPATTSRLH